MLSSKSVSALLQLKESLDSTLTGFAIAGLPLPDELAEEFAAVQSELARRDPDEVLAVQTSKPLRFTDWLGCTLGEWTIDYLVAESPYWFLFHAFGADGVERWLKIARELTDYADKDNFARFSTRALAIDDVVVRPVVPQQNALLVAEVERHRLLFDDPVVIAKVNDMLYTSHGVPPGKSLRHFIDEVWPALDPPEILPAFVAVAGALETFSQGEESRFHGNLKPDNIIIDADRIAAGGSGADPKVVCFIELGNYGAMSCLSGLEEEVCLTTPEYYPWLDGDDIGALGICLWEALLGYHPFLSVAADVAGTGWSNSSNMSLCSEPLKNLVEFELSLSNEYVAPLLRIKLPRDLAPLAVEQYPALEEVLLKAIKLKLGPDGLLYEDAGYSSISELKEALSSICS
jgi:hypothetical protein